MVTDFLLDHAALSSCARILPELTGERFIVEHTDNALMDVDEAAF